MKTGITIRLDFSEVDTILNALRYAAEGAAEEIRYCHDPELENDLQESIDAAEQLFDKIAELSKEAQNC